MITHLEPDILECEVKWAFGSITMNKDSWSNGIPAELFQILKDDTVKVLHSIFQQIWKTRQWPQDWKKSIFIQSQRKAIPKNVQTTTQLHLSHVLAKWCPKFSKPDFISTWNHEIPDAQAEFRKGRGTRDQIVIIHWIIGKAREFQTTLPASWKICMQVQKQQLELDMK